MGKKGIRMVVSRYFINVLLRIPVPWVFVLAYFAALVPQFLIPFSLATNEKSYILRITGIILFIAGAVAAGWSLMIFHANRNTTTPGEKSEKLITGGPYRITRNPMYAGLFLAYLGEDFFLNHVWPLVCLPLLFVYLNGTVIPLEEKILEERFGSGYADYCSGTGRWF